MDRSKSIEQLERNIWSEPDVKTSLIVKCHQLRKIPIKDLSIEDLRILIGQQIGLKFILPVALEIVEENPFVGGDMYAGDLLFAIGSIDKEFWESDEDLNNRLVEIKDNLSILASTINNDLLPLLDKFQYK